MLDVNRENTQLRGEVDAAMAEVCESGAFVHGPACARFEAAMAEYCGVEACRRLRFGQRCAACWRCWRWASGRATK